MPVSSLLAYICINMMALELSKTAVPVETKSAFYNPLASYILLFYYLDFNGKMKEEIWPVKSSISSM